MGNFTEEQKSILKGVAMGVVLGIVLNIMYNNRPSTWK